MKTNPYFKILLLFACIAIVGCSKKEDPILNPTEELSITLGSDAGNSELEVLPLGRLVNFTVTGSDGEDYTVNAKIYVNDTQIEGSSYTFSDIGTFNVKAIYEGVTSNIIDFQVLSESERALTIDVPRAMKNQTITFGLIGSDGNNTASQATFYVDGTAIPGFIYSSANEGNFEVYAEYISEGDTLTTTTKSFSVYTPLRKVVLEDYTGTWCGYCLKALVAIDSVKKLTDYVSVVAIHKKSFTLPEPMDFPDIALLQNEFNVPNSFPQTQLNRTVRWNEPYNYNAVTNLAGVETDNSIAINSQITGSNLSVDVKVVYRNGSEPGDKVVVYLLESGVIADQANYFNTIPEHEYFGAGDPILNFVHNDALRNSLSNLFGDNIPETSAFEEYKKTYTFNVPSNYNAANLSFVVMVVKADNSAKNSQHAKLGENKMFE